MRRFLHSLQESTNNEQSFSVGTAIENACSFCDTIQVKVIVLGCIADAILEQGFDKTGILTDGYASLNKEKQEELKARKTQVLTVLFGGRMDCDEFAPLGDVVQLEDVTE